MKELIRAALDTNAARMLLVDVSPFTVRHLVHRPETTLVAVLYSQRRGLKKCRELLGNDGRFRLFDADLSMLPFGSSAFDVVIVDADRQRWDDPVRELRSLRTLVRSGGAVMVVNRLSEGVIGKVSSTVSRVFRHQPLPCASDLTRWMLLAGMRRVRQANVSTSVVPTVVTWADVRNRPWEGVVREVSL